MCCPRRKFSVQCPTSRRHTPLTDDRVVGKTAGVRSRPEPMMVPQGERKNKNEVGWSGGMGRRCSPCLRFIYPRARVGTNAREQNSFGPPVAKIHPRLQSAYQSSLIGRSQPRSTCSCPVPPSGACVFRLHCAEPGCTLTIFSPRNAPLGQVVAEGLIYDSSQQYPSPDLLEGVPAARESAVPARRSRTGQLWPSRLDITRQRQSPSKQEASI